MAREIIETTCADCEERFDTPTTQDGSPVWITCEECRQQYRLPVSVVFKPAQAAHGRGDQS